ncbi:MerR family transcriptional regulator, Zn(II)-responsive regulator of zntA [Dehalogenimonas formicexedens]|uniref:MerR family transcriptional regulator, Zn(II)-responsive regulator of zntA n=1 Tax=Dehalogenimonas formicexedens TaxID=1839801 RepID=A0A1P8F9Q8_9CHLR|nr:MerR family transcriptional regulator [Dehalogenimonas formicexedens]APV45170.1 MerR family transcriptional regulator, Zn(II)-responsive regulator of zntA [Dehalogenimonas formicexedens]
MTEYYQIGDLARRASISTRAARFYEEKGLLSAASRTSGGMRLYDESDVKRVRLIRRLQNTGLELEDIRHLLDTSPGSKVRQDRVAHTLSVLNLEAERSRERMAQLAAQSLEREEIIELVSRCRECAAETCPVDCPPRNHII